MSGTGGTADGAAGSGEAARADGSRADGAGDGRRLGLRDRLAIARASLRGEQRELAQEVDARLERPAAALERQRRFIAGASHELRGPLSVIRAEAEVALANPDADGAELRHTAEVVLETAERTQALLESLLTLARSQRGLRRRDDCDLAVAARAAISRAGEAMRESGVRAHAELERAPLSGDDRLLESAAANLVENAVRYNRHNGTVAVTTGVEDGRARLLVVNTGPRLAPEDVERLAEPFQRLEPRGARSGAGLGLSIVSAVADAHGGELRLTPGKDGGLRAELMLPARPR